MPAATYSFKGTADFSAHNKEVEGARKEIKKYEDGVKSAQKESNKLANPNFSKAYSSQKQLQNTVKNTTNIMNGLSGNMMGAISKFGPYAAAAVASFKVVEAAINKARSVNEDFNDQVGKLSAQLKGSFDDLANHISRMDFTNLLSGLATAAKYAGQLYDSMDRAGTFKMVSNPAIGEAQNEITALRIQIQQLQVKQKELKKQGKDYSDIEAQVAALNAQIDVQLKKLKAIYEQQRKNAYKAASDAAAYMGVNRENVSGLYNNRGVNPQLMNVALAAMNGMPNYIQAQNNTPGGLLSMLDVGKLVNFIANDIGSPLINNIQDDFKKLLAAWDAGNTALANEMSRKLFGIDASQMNDTLDAISNWVRESHSRFTEGANGNLTTYTNALNDANAARAAYLSAQQQHVGDQSAQVRVQWVPTGGSGGGKNTPELPEGSIAKLEKQIQDLKEKYNLATTDEGENGRNSLKKQIEEAEAELKKLKGEMNNLPAGSLAQWKDDLKTLQLQWELATTDADRAKIKEAMDTAQAEIDRINGVVIPVNVEPEEGSIAYLQKKIAEKKQEMERSGDLEFIIKCKLEIEGLEAELTKLTDATKTPTEQANESIEAMQERYKQLGEDGEAAAGVIASAFSTMAQCSDEGSARILNGFATITQQIAQMIPSILSLMAAHEGEAMASGVAGAAKVPYPANIAAIASIVAQLLAVFGTIASISKYADGGIFEGTGSRIGDMHLARVNPGEMILNGRQQANLFRLLNGNMNFGSNNEISGNVRFEIEGTKLVGVLGNYNRKISRVKP